MVTLVALPAGWAWGQHRRGTSLPCLPARQLIQRAFVAILGVTRSGHTSRRLVVGIAGRTPKLAIRAAAFAGLGGCHPKGECNLTLPSNGQSQAGFAHL